MPNQELLDFIKQSKEAGQTDEQIMSALKAAGWQSEDIKAGFLPPDNSSAPPMAPTPEVPAKPAQNYSDVLYGNNSVNVINVNNEKKDKPKHRLFKKIILSIAGVIIFLIAFFFVFPYVAGFFSKDISPIDDSDLQLLKVEISESENSYFDLAKLDKKVFDSLGDKILSSDFLSGAVYKPEYLNDQKFINDLLLKNAEALRYFDAASKKPYYQDPVAANPKNFGPSMVLPSLNPYRQIARVSAVKAVYLAKNERYKESFDELIKIIGIGNKIQKSQGTLIHYLVGLAIQNLGLDMARNIIYSYNITPDILIYYSKKLNEYNNNEIGLVNAFKAEHMNIMAATDEAINEPAAKYGIRAKSIFYYKPNETKSLFSELTRAQIKDTNCSSNMDETEILINKYDIGINKENSAFLYIKLFFTENAIAKLLFQIVGVSLNTASIRACNENLNVSALQAMMAIKAYKIQNGNYPATLQVLIPNYLSEIPKDPYNGQPIKYSKEKRIIYSVGKDKKDDGGSEGDDWIQMPDPTFKIDF